uniref:Uncharacterized protein n=1 Tax=Cercocebus atys TaxID=9531 RepID=A0A2K5NLJ8_CERAT
MGSVWVGELPVSEGMWENCPLGWVKKKASRTLGPLDFLLQRKRLRLWASEPGVHRFGEAGQQFCQMRGSRLTGGRKGLISSGLRFGREGFSEEVLPQPVLKVGYGKVHSLCPTQGTRLFSPDGPAGSGASIWPAEGAEGLTAWAAWTRKMSVCSEENAKAGGCTAFPLLLSPLGARMTGREHAHKGPELTTPLRGFGALAQPSPPLGTSTPSAVLLSAAT